MRDALERSRRRPTADSTTRSSALKHCERRFATETPFAFYAWLLGGDGGRARILKRLGHEANDALDEFLELALAYERKAPASLQGFMAWLRAADTRGEARHGDLARRGPRHDRARRQGTGSAGGVPGGHHVVAAGHAAPETDPSAAGNARRSAGVVVWAGRKADDPAAVAAARTAMLDETEDEYRRLLYVAMTRAADRLIVGGCMPGNMNSVRKHSWYDLIVQGPRQFRIADRRRSRRPTAR